MSPSSNYINREVEGGKDLVVDAVKEKGYVLQPLPTKRSKTGTLYRDQRAGILSLPPVRLPKWGKARSPERVKGTGHLLFLLCCFETTTGKREKKKEKWTNAS